jgi:hypothetical protein
MEQRIVKKLITSIAFGSLVYSSSVFAGSQTGVLSAWVTHAAIPGRGPCVQMIPAVPGGGGYACLYKNTDNYNEIAAALLAAQISERTVTIWWDTEGADGHKIIAQVQVQ